MLLVIVLVHHGNHPINGGHQPEQAGINRNRKSNGFPPGEHWKDSGDFSSYCFIYKARRLSHRLDTNYSNYSLDLIDSISFSLGYCLFGGKNGKGAHARDFFYLFLLFRVKKRGSLVVTV
jgi:hypothetical protein